MDPLKEKFFEKSASLKADIKTILKDHGDKKIDEVTIEQLIGGMRSVRSMIWDTSSLDPEEGIRFRGYNIPQLRELLPRIPNGKEPLPEGLFWLMMVGEIPTIENVRWLSAEWQKRSSVEKHVFDTLDALPKSTHPMTQFSIAVLAMQSESIFAQKYEEGMSKNDYWDVMYEDSMNLIAKLPRVAAYIYRRSFHNDVHITPKTDMDWAGNFAHMLGYDDADFKALMRLYMTIHADHEGGNASAHTMHLVGSTLSDVYYSFSASMNSLAGPLHGLANQEVIKWIFEMVEELGTNNPDKDQIRKYINDTLAEGKVVPGYGHAVLRQPDPRFIAQKRFAEDNIPDDPIVQIVWDLFELVPEILGSLGKVKNPWPNVDAHSGALLVHYGLKEYNFYTVLFGVSRALGVCAGLCWDRALGLPLERPKSITTDWLKQYIANN
ncbi:MAG: citrate (Si)-synthase, eukaryotic [Saprospiraceae bacterium]|nr:citrate (Si)-synthase, eukaryotic [Saprospiraceae bacterium]